ncbi:MAG TPA: HDIG domain-containing protein [Bacilli bacterium]|nr:HDIG domain-containing protein [Bacilli bacterium]
MRSNLLNNIRQITLSPELRKSRSLRFTIYLLIATLLFFLFIGNVLPERYDYAVGSIAEEDIKAPTDAVDNLMTRKLKEEAKEAVPRQYTKDTEVEDRSYGDLNQIFEIATRINGNHALSEADRLDEWKKQTLPVQLQEEDLKRLAAIDIAQVPDLKSEAIRIMQKLYGEDIYEETLLALDQKLDIQLTYVDLSKDNRLVIKTMVKPLIRPNMIYDYQMTTKKREEAADAVPAVQINKGEIVVKKGEKIDEHAYSKLNDLKLLSKDLNYAMYFGYAGMIILTVLLLYVFLEMSGSSVGQNNLLLLCLGIIIILTAAGIKTLSLGESLGFANIGYLTPVAMGTMLVTILFDTQLAIFLSFLFALLTGSAFDFKFQYVFVSFISGLVGAYAVSKVKHRTVIMRAGFIIAGINLVTISIQAMLSTTGLEVASYLQSLLFGIISGLFSAVITIGVLPFLESSFGILTPMTLLELSNPNHPLLKKLLMEAPGTYHHSLIVGNLAEAAAEAVGADPLLCRVGAYYHDVGKMKRPLFFIENQLSKDNPHDKIAPSLSHLIITSHVRDGLEMQDQHRLPKAIRDICEQHHGTTILWYFYNKALEQDKSGSVNVDDFRYPGPKPQTKEAALVMLCDAVEAAVRSMSRPTPNRIEAVIHKIFKDRLNDGQLDECDLTLKDLDKCADAFLRTLNGIYHARIEYPDPPKAKDDGKRA